MATLTPDPLGITLELLEPKVFYVTTLSKIRAAIVAHILRVSGVGNVYEIEPSAQEPAEIPTTWRFNGGAVRAWTLQQERGEPQDLSNQDTLRMYRFVIRGYVEFNDAEQSQTLFEDLAELISQVFRNTLRLGLTDVVDRVFEPTFENPSLRTLGGAILVHYGELRLRVQARYERSPTP